MAVKENQLMFLGSKLPNKVKQKQVSIVSTIQVFEFSVAFLQGTLLAMCPESDLPREQCNFSKQHQLYRLFK